MIYDYFRSVEEGKVYKSNYAEERRDWSDRLIQNKEPST